MKKNVSNRFYINWSKRRNKNCLVVQYSQKRLEQIYLNDYFLF